jgi:hypothetical protein
VGQRQIRDAIGLWSGVWCLKSEVGGSKPVTNRAWWRLGALLLIALAAAVVVAIRWVKGHAVGPPTFVVIYTGDTRGYLEDCG